MIDLLFNIKEWLLCNFSVYQILHLLILTGGFWVASKQLINNVNAQRALRSPQIYVFCPEGADLINGLVIKNAGEIIATNITIIVSEKRRGNTFLKKLPKHSDKFIPLLTKEDAVESIFVNHLDLNNYSDINVEVKYHSPYYYKTTLKYKNTFSRGGNYE